MAEHAKWAFKREVSVGDMLAFVLVAFAVVAAYFALDKRISFTERADIQQEMVDEWQNRQHVDLKMEIRGDLGRIENKVDQLIRDK